MFIKKNSCSYFKFSNLILNLENDLQEIDKLLEKKFGLKIKMGKMKVMINSKQKITEH